MDYATKIFKILASIKATQFFFSSKRTFYLFLIFIMQIFVLLGLIFTGIKIFYKNYEPINQCIGSMVDYIIIIGFILSAINILFKLQYRAIIIREANKICDFYFSKADVIFCDFIDKILNDEKFKPIDDYKKSKQILDNLNLKLEENFKEDFYYIKSIFVFYSKYKSRKYLKNFY